MSEGLLSWDSCSSVFVRDMVFYDRIEERIHINPVGERE